MHFLGGSNNIEYCVNFVYMEFVSVHLHRNWCGGFRVLAQNGSPVFSCDVIMPLEELFLRQGLSGARAMREVPALSSSSMMQGEKQTGAPKRTPDLSDAKH